MCTKLCQLETLLLPSYFLLHLPVPSGVPCCLSPQQSGRASAPGSRCPQLVGLKHVENGLNRPPRWGPGASDRPCGARSRAPGLKLPLARLFDAEKSLWRTITSNKSISVSARKLSQDRIFSCGKEVNSVLLLFNLSLCAELSFRWEREQRRGW